MTEPRPQYSTSGIAPQGGQPDQWPAFLAHLHRGGAAGYWWILPGKASTWWPAGNPAPIPSRANVYFGVHPAADLPERWEDGAKIPLEKCRATIPDIAAVNCLFAEYDAKDYGDKAAILAHVDGLAVAPSVLIDSGGGIHAYWLLRSPFVFAEQADRERARLLQAAWVAYVGGDGGAKDLARVLRVPGTVNSKYDPPRPVTILRADLSRLYGLGDLETLCKPPEPKRQAPAGNGNGRGPSEDSGQFWLDKALARCVPHGGDYSRNATGLWLAQQLRDVGLSEADAEPWLLAYARDVSSSGDVYGDGEALASLRSAYRKQQKREYPQSQVARSKPQRQAVPAPQSADGAEAPPATIGPAPEHHTDLGNARRLVRLHGHDLRFVKAWGWLAWDRKRWERDETGEIMRRAKRVALSFYDDAQGAFDLAKTALTEAQEAQKGDDPTRAEEAEKRAKEANKRAVTLASWGKTSQARPRLESMVVLAQSEEPVIARAETFDTKPWLFNVANGTLDLRTGELRPHDRADLLTKVSPVAYDPGASCPLWLAFLHRIQAGNPDLIAFLQRVVGYCLTGSVREKAFFVLWGTGDNGKTTFLETIGAMLGEDYTQTIRAETLMSKDHDNIPTDVAKLRGARLVSAQESEEGRKLAEGLVKRMTGMDTLTARFLYHDEFSYRPEFKLFLSTNRKPTVTGSDPAIWNRIKLIPFAVTIPKAEQDTELLTKLKAELPGILAWAVRGCLAWQRDGLKVPETVKAATEAYRAESDTLGAFLAECTEEGETLQAQAGPLFSAYDAWRQRNKEQELTRVAFARQLEERGFDKYTDKSTRKTFYVGLGLSQGGQS